MRESRYSVGVPIAAILGLSLICSVWMLGNSVVKARRSAEVIHVTGSSHRNIRSDYIIWQCNLEEERPKMSDAYDKVHGDVIKVQDYLLAQGIAKEEIFVLPISTVQLHPAQEANHVSDASVSRPITGYKLTQGIQIRSHNVDGVDKVARDSTELVSKGINVSSGAPEYLYTKMDTLKLEMINDAAKDARNRATGIATSSGNRLGDLKSARMGVIQIEALSATDGATDSGANDTSSLDKKVTSIVKADYAIR